MKRYGIVIPVVFLALLAALGCDATDLENESNRSVVVVSSINEGAPFFADVLDQGDTLYTSAGTYFAQDDFIVEDIVEVKFFNRPYDQSIVTGPGNPYGDFLVTSYNIEWTVLANNSITTFNVPPTIEAATNIIVQSGSEGGGFILLVPYSHKRYTNVWNLRLVPAGGSEGEIITRARITFRGHEVGTDHKILIPVDLTVSWGDIVETEEL